MRGPYRSLQIKEVTDRVYFRISEKFNVLELNSSIENIFSFCSKFFPTFQIAVKYVLSRVFSLMLPVKFCTVAFLFSALFNTRAMFWLKTL